MMYGVATSLSWKLIPLLFEQYLALQLFQKRTTRGDVGG